MRHKPLAGSMVTSLVWGVCLFVLATLSYGQQTTADLILRNGKIVTVDSSFSIAQAVAVTGNQISAVGSDADVMKQISGIIQKYKFKPGEWIHFDNAVSFGGLADEVSVRHGKILFDELNRWELDKAAPNNPI